MVWSGGLGWFISGTAAGWWTNLDKGTLLFRMTPGKVIVQRNAGYAVLAVQMDPLAQSVP